MSGRNTAVSEEEAVLGVPLVRIIHRIGIHIPAVMVPVHIDRAKRFVPHAICATAL